EAEDVTRNPRLERTFCMKGCSDDSDCRDRYYCATPEKGNFRVVDLTANPPEQKICIADARDAQKPPTDTGNPPVCSPGNAGAPWTPYTPDGGMSGAGGASSTSSSSSTSGAGGASSTSSSSSTSGAGGMGGMGGMGGTDGGVDGSADGG